MIGVFDSGVGGLNSYSELRRLLRGENMIYLSDSINAPYGTKSKEELKIIVSQNIKLLTDMGADKVLIACCTASAVYEELDEEIKSSSIPIIGAATDAVSELLEDGDTVAVIATDYTASSGVFGNKIHSVNPKIRVYEIATQMLVGLVELGAKDGELLPREAEVLDSVSSRISALSPKALILGCTHFSCLRGELEKRLPGVSVINTALLGARKTAQLMAEEKQEILYK